MRVEGPLLVPMKVQLDRYYGPLDLLLYLVRRNELDILAIPLGRITREFLELLVIVELIDLEVAGDFVVVASALMEIKSRSALPQQAEEKSEDPNKEASDIPLDPNSDLVRQLVEYKKYREAALLLEEQSAIWQERFPRLSDERPVDQMEPSQDRIREVELWDLVSAFSRILRQHPENETSSIVNDDTPISVYLEEIRTRVLTAGALTFEELFQVGERERNISRGVVISLFLALLELIRHYQFRAIQAETGGEIKILPPDTSP